MQGLVLWGDAGLDAKTSRNPLMGYKAQERTELGDHVGSVLDKVTQQVKNLPEMQETQVQSLGREDLLEKKWPPTQYSCLENPMDSGAW